MDIPVPLIAVEQIAEMVKVTARRDSASAGFSSAPWSSNTSHSLEDETDEESEKSDVMKFGPDAGENP